MVHIRHHFRAQCKGDMYATRPISRATGSVNFSNWRYNAPSEPSELTGTPGCFWRKLRLLLILWLLYFKLNKLFYICKLRFCFYTTIPALCNVYESVCGIFSIFLVFGPHGIYCTFYDCLKYLGSGLVHYILNLDIFECYWTSLTVWSGNTNWIVNGTMVLPWLDDWT